MPEGSPNWRFALHEEWECPEEIEGLRVCGMLHDLGKVVISSGILSKPGKLSHNEFGIIREHPETAFQALHRIPFPWPVAEVVSQHHERLDGKGYPYGLKEGEIHPWARILAVADVVDAMITHRPYRPALPKKIVIEELNRGRGTVYDSRVVDECKAVMQQDFNRVMVVDDEPALVTSC
jgi:putative two-component system response regulator